MRRTDGQGQQARGRKYRGSDSSGCDYRVARARCLSSWHVVAHQPPGLVANARLSKTVLKNIDPTITTVVYRKCGEGNVEVRGFEHTERVSASRRSRRDAGVRRGTTTIMQFQKLVEGDAVFSRIKQSYLNCTPDSFGYKHRTE